MQYMQYLSKTGGCYSHRLYSHSCNCSVNGQGSNHPNRCSQRSKWSQNDSQRSNPSAERTQITVLQFAPNLSVGLHMVVKGQWPKQWSNSRREPVKVLTRGRSCDYRVYGSDTPLAKAFIPTVLKGYLSTQASSLSGFVSSKTDVVAQKPRGR